MLSLQLQHVYGGPIVERSTTGRMYVSACFVML